VLEVQNLAVSFGGVHAVRDVTFAAQPDHVTGVVGPNGAGKTTLFNMISGFQRPDRGRVIFEGLTLSGRKPNRIAAAGLVRTFQKTEVFDALTVRKAVEIGAMCGRRFPLWRVVLPRAVREVHVHARADALTTLDLCGLAAKADATCDALSYGEQRLLGIAVALAARPRMILLDEPASGLNPTEARALGDLIGRIRANGTGVLLIEHNMSLVMRVSDRIVVLHHGEKIAEGRPETIARDPAVLDAYLGQGFVHA
jgi:branched-chain amino acid transport system ATP-binding protein